MGFQVGPRTISATGGSIKRVGNYRIHTFPSELVTDGLVLNLDAGDPRSYPGSGTSWTNMSGGGHNATLINGATYNNENGGSIVLDGGTQYVSIPGTSSSPWAFGQNGTIEQWVYVNGNTGTNNRFWCVINSSSSLDAYLNGSTYNIGLHGGSVITSTAIPQGVWTHLVVTYTSGTIKVYFNGIEQGLTGTTTGYNSTTTSELSVGDFYNHGQNYELNGRISAMKIYNRALSPAEVAQNYDALKVRYTSYTNTFTPLCGGGSGKVEVLCVAGGGGGGKGTSGGGGGAGGLLYNSAFTVNSNTGIGITVGDGGTGTTADGTQATNGGNSIFSTLTSIGGGYGGNENGGNSSMRNGNSGGSGGGGSYHGNGSSGTTGQGNSGGNGTSGENRWTGGGGGGAGSSGASATAYYGGDGGSGLAYSISGTSSYYAGGGGGAAQSQGGQTVYGGNGGLGGGGTGPADQTGSQVLPGVSGIPNTGGGGSGGVDSVSVSSGNGSNGIVIVRYPATDYNVELLVVGGGGGGGGSVVSYGGGGGGGSGGLLYYSSYPVSAGTKYTVTVGAGGTGQNASTGANGSNGNNSVFGSVVAFGGGGGSNGSGAGTGNNGGSGGGGGYRVYTTVENGGFGISGQGNNGGGVSSVSASGAGGGGAGGAGQSNTGGSSGVGGVGGVGLTYAITGSSVTYAAGGQAGEGAAVPGSANTGNGGAGTYADSNSNTGYAGGSGIIIIAYQGPQRGLGGTVDTTSRPGYTLHKFTTTGTDFFIP